MLMTPEVASMPIMEYVAMENARRRAVGEMHLLISDPTFDARVGVVTAGDLERDMIKTLKEHLT